MIGRTTEPATACEAAWLLVGSEGLWAADCLMAGCGWTVTTGGCDAALAACATHAGTHITTDTTSDREVSR